MTKPIPLQESNKIQFGIAALFNNLTFIQNDNLISQITYFLYFMRNHQTNLILRQFIIYLCNNFPFALIDEKNLETQLGFWFDDGKQLSMGEWQLLGYL